MKKLSLLLSFALIFLFMVIAPFNATGRLWVNKSKIDSKLLKKINSDGSSIKTVIVFLNTKKSAINLKTNSRSSKNAVFSKLRTLAKSSQKDLISTLYKDKANRQITKYHPFWLINAVLVKANGDEIKKLAARSDVKKIIEDFKIKRPELPKVVKKGPASLGGVEWNIDKIGADRVWDTSSYVDPGGNKVDGTGVKVGILDTGVDGTHPDLAGKIDQFAKFNDTGDLQTASASEASDPYGHGTHVAGIIAGGDAGGTDIGVAPGAKLIVGSFGLFNWTYSNAVKGMEWIVDPDKDPATDDGASIVNMSFGYGTAMPQFFKPIDNMVAAGVLPAVSIGNEGEDNTSSPGDIPSSLGVGATDSQDKVTYWSSGGTAEFFDAPYEGKWLKPDISAPGDSIRSAISGIIKILEGGQWAELSGTSMAAPHVAGAAALLKQYNPGLTVDELRQLLEISSADLGSAGKDSRFGNGRLDIKKAIDYAKTAGTLQGKVDYSGEGIESNIKVVELGAVLRTDHFGNFQTMLPAGTYTLEVSAYGYLPKTINDVVIAKDSTTNQDITFDISPKYTISGNITDKSTGKPIAAATLYVKDRAVKTKSLSDGSFSIKLPAGSYTLITSAGGYEEKSLDIDVPGDLTQDFEMDHLPGILLIADYWETDYSSYYKDALDALGEEYTFKNTYDPKTGEYFEPAANDLKQYQTVILASDYIPNILLYGGYFNPDTGEEQQNPVENYLDAGGKLFVAGQDIGWYLGDSGEGEYMMSKKIKKMSLTDMTSDYFSSGNFLDYLHVEYVADKSKNLSLLGQTGSIMDGVNFSIYNVNDGDDGANNQFLPDVMKSTDNKSTRILKYTEDTTGSAAFAVQDGKYKIVYLAFGFEGISSSAARESVMDKSLDWLAKDTYPPSLKLVLHKGKTSFKGKTTFTASAKDDKAIKKVEFLLDGKLQKRDWLAPYNIDIDTSKYSSGKHSLKVIAFDTSNNKSSTTQQITFDNIKPKISIGYPYQGVVLSGATKLKATASDNLGLEKVVFFIDSTKISSDVYSPYESSVNTEKFLNGSHTIKMVALDKAGNTSVASIKISFFNTFKATIALSPNPFSPDGDNFNDKTTIYYQINQPGNASLDISNWKGVIYQPLNGVYKNRGFHSFTWDGKMSNGEIAKNGNYRLNFMVSDWQQRYSTYKIISIKSPPVALSDISCQPNPFSPDGDSKNDTSNISFNLNHRAYVSVNIYNYKGKVATLANNQIKNAGKNSFAWNGKDDDGKILPNGNYRCTITATDINDSTAYADMVVSLVAGQ